MSDLPCILVVDDEEPNRELLRAMLRSQYRVVIAQDGAQALKLLEREPVDLVLLDVMMPGTTGYEVCRAIKARYRDRFLPVLLVTALGRQDDRNQGLEHGADDFLTKPIDRRELLLRVKAFLRLRAQEAFIAAQMEKLAKLQEMKDELLSLLVHDMRGPLSGVMAHLELLRDDLPQGIWREDAESALQGAHAIAAALEETLQIRLLEEGHLPVHRATVDLAEVVESGLVALAPVAKRKGVALHARVDGARSADIDAALVRRAIENLVNNAVKYTPGGREVQVVARQADGLLTLEVADRGPGIPEHLKGSMFEKFGSVEASRGGPRKGFGLGLYLVKLVAEGHAGTATVRDREGGGAVFALTMRSVGAAA